MKKAQKDTPQDDQSTEAQVTEVDSQISQTAELTTDIQRIQAEFINYKNRVELEKATLSQFSKIQVIKDLLPVVDDLERALGHLPEDLKDNKWAQGAAKVYDRLQRQLEKLGVTIIQALNQPFNPELHEAVQVEGEGDTQVITEVLQQGYRLENQIIRHAIVKVTNT